MPNSTTVTRGALEALNGRGALFSKLRRDHKDDPVVAKLDGKLRTFPNRPSRFIQPVRIGRLKYESITEEDAEDWSLTADGAR